MEEKKLTDEELDELIKKLEYQSWSQNFYELSQAAYMLKQQKAEIERLTEENGYLKQCADTFLEDCKRERNQAEKDTAKEILDDIKFLVEERNGADIEDLSVDGTILEEILAEIAKKKGVEVE